MVFFIKNCVFDSNIDIFFEKNKKRLLSNSKSSIF